MKRLKLIYNGIINGEQLIDLDTGENILDKNYVRNIRIDFNIDSPPRLILEILPEYVEVEIDGKIEQKVKRAKLK